LEAAVVALLSLLLLLVEMLHQLPKWVPLHWEFMTTTAMVTAVKLELMVVVVLVVVMGAVLLLLLVMAVATTIPPAASSHPSSRPRRRCSVLPPTLTPVTPSTSFWCTRPPAPLPLTPCCGCKHAVLAIPTIAMTTATTVLVATATATSA
jgi:hypothetical protein